MTSVQEAVTSIREAAGSDSQMILLPGTDYTSVGAFISDGSASALSAVTNPDGSVTNLIFDVHQYLDSDGSGTSTECTTDGTANLGTLATWLRDNNRQAYVPSTAALWIYYDY